ncbi:hypothetical protein LCGC14_1268610 [marine sediment metagenome]|uniref:Uncharacterized protein n=1 Tax=marine sediment metagenome TaxID=412755 RepID=A0A0F9L0K7_9ZZZZ
MALDSLDSISRRVLLRFPAAGYPLAREWVAFAFRQVAERRRWSWLVKENQFLFPDPVTAGTVTVTRSSAGVVGSGTAFTGAMIGRQFRVGNQTPLYTITAVTDATNLTIERVWGGTTAAAIGYEIFNAYATVPSDFHSFITVVDAKQNWQLHLHRQQVELNSFDPQRANSGNPWWVLFRDYDTVSTPPLPRYEIWPHVKQEYVLFFLYEVRAEDLWDSGASLPRYIRGDVLLEMALAEASRWPGPSAANPNPGYDLKLHVTHLAKVERALNLMELQDDELWAQDYSRFTDLPFAPFDSSFMQRHDFSEADY